MNGFIYAIEIKINILYLQLFRSLLAENYVDLRNDMLKIDDIIDDNSGESENIINKYIYDELSTYSKDLGNISFKNKHYESSIEVESVKSHGKLCTMVPFDLGTELGDIILNVDHILIEDDLKIINGVSSIIQTKKEDYVKKGLSARQLYLMSQWPEFTYKGIDWEFDVYKDIFSFYLFITDTMKQKYKSSMMSSYFLIKLLGLNKDDLSGDIKGVIKVPDIRIIQRERINSITLPFSFTSYMLRMFNLSIGSQSNNVRSFLKYNFFNDMEEVEDCPFDAITVMKSRGIQEDILSPFFHGNLIQTTDDDELMIIRIKVYMKLLDE